MFLLSAATAFRGDSARMVLLSDLFTKEIPMPDLGLGSKVTVSNTYYCVYFDGLMFLPFRYLLYSQIMPSTIRTVV